MGFDASKDDEITAIWAELQARVALLARRENKEINNGLDIDDVIANLDASQEKEEESPAAQAVEVAFGRTMGLIKTVGGIVADGASSVTRNQTLKQSRFCLTQNGYSGLRTGWTML